jgi:hypothetical protein
VGRCGGSGGRHVVSNVATGLICNGLRQDAKKWSNEHILIDDPFFLRILGCDECNNDTQDTLVLEEGSG